MLRLLLDHNIPPKVSDWLAPFDVDCLNVRDAGLKTASDHKLLHFAKLEDRIIVTKDSDFPTFVRSNQSLNVSVVWLRVGNIRNRDLEPWLVERWHKISDLFARGHSIIELR